MHPEMIITGIPRSGTSYLCKVLHETANCVIINEPTEIMSMVKTREDLQNIQKLYTTLRDKINTGQAVINKVVNHKMIEDTAKIPSDQQYNLYYPVVTRPDFLLGTKNPLMYMARLPWLHQLMPDSKIVALIRHPLDTIASWKNSFKHLAQVSIHQLPAGHAEDKLLQDWQRQKLFQIEKTDNLALKRALFWAYLAEQLYISRNFLLVIRYEDLMSNPELHLKKIFNSITGLPAEIRPTQAVSPSKIRCNRSILDEEDRIAIYEVCEKIASKFGYYLTHENCNIAI